jgi:hypothetical protein
MGGRAPADAIAVFGTGVDGGGNPLPGGSVDTHYALTGGTSYVIGDPGSVGWINNTATSAWISGSPDTFAGGGPFTYTTTFMIGAGFNPATAQLSGVWAADDQAAMYLNGSLVAQTVNTFSGPWSFFENFSVTSGFVSGLNTLSFSVPNNIETPNDGPTGLQVSISGTVAPAPEPSSLVLAGLGGLGAVAYGWRKRRRKIA